MFIAGMLYEAGAQFLLYLETIPSSKLTLSNIIPTVVEVGGIITIIYGIYVLYKYRKPQPVLVLGAKEQPTEKLVRSLSHGRRIVVKGKTLKNQDVYLDGHSWVKCHFDGCNIIMERGDFDLISNSFNNCKLTAKGGAEGILKLAKLFFPQIPLVEPSIKDTDQQEKP